MAKRKKRINPAIKIGPTTNTDDPCAQRLSNLALELTLAAGQVLKEDFDFNENQVNEWLDKTLARAKTNRTAPAE